MEKASGIPGQRKVKAECRITSTLVWSIGGDDGKSGHGAGAEIATVHVVARTSAESQCIARGIPRPKLLVKGMDHFDGITFKYNEICLDVNGYVMIF